MSWTEIETDPSFQALPVDRKERIKTNYFNKEIASKVPGPELDNVRQSFFGSRFSDNDKTTNDGVTAIGGILKRAVDTNVPGMGLLWDQFQKGIQGTKEGAKIGMGLAGQAAKAALNPGEAAMTELRKVPIPGAETLNKAVKESAGGVADVVSQTVARSGHPELAVPAGVAVSVASGPGLAYLANPEVKNMADIAQMAMAGKFFDMLASIPSPEIPPLRYVYNNIRYKLGVSYPDYFSKGETGLTPVNEQSLRQAVNEGTISLANAMRANPSILRDELNKRGLTPEQLKTRPPITPEETADTILKAEDLVPGASKSAQLAPRTFTAATSISQAPAAAAERLGAFQGQINAILGLPKGTPVTPESYHKAMQTGKLNLIEGLEIDEQIFKAEATKEGIPDQVQGQLYQHSKIAAQKPVEFKVLKDLAQKSQSELNPAAIPTDPAKTPEFHEMTKEQFQAEATKVSGGSVDPEMAAQVHQQIIEEAIGQGKDVPGEVVASHAPVQTQPEAVSSSAEPVPVSASSLGTPGSQGQEISKPAPQEIGPSQWSITDNPKVVNMPPEQRVKALLQDEARAYGVPDTHPDLPQWVSNRAYQNKEATFGALRRLGEDNSPIDDEKIQRMFDSIMRDNDRMDTLQRWALIRPQTNVELDVMGRPQKPWTPEDTGWRIKDIKRAGVIAERDNDIVVKTASDKFKAYKEDNLIGEFDTAKKAVRSIEAIDEQEEQLKEQEEKDFMKQAKMTPAKEARLGSKAALTPRSGQSSSGTFASKGEFVEVEPEPAGLEDLPIKRAMPLEMPELVKFSRELLGKYPDISRRMGKQTMGLFTTSGGFPNIKLRPELFEDSDKVAKVLAHEIGHANDYFPEETMSRGNLIGRVMSFKKYLSNTFGGDLQGNIPGLKYTAKELRQELIGLSEFWRPWNRDTATPQFIAYRDSGKELYADALSVFLNSPGTLKKMAPKFFESLMLNLDRKPDFKAEWLNIQDLLNGARENTLKSRREDIRQMGMKSEEILIRKQIEKSQQLQSSADQLAQGLLDRYYPILKVANEYEAKGNKIPDHLNPKYVFQEGDMVGNDIAIMDMKLDSILTPLQRDYALGPVELHEYGFNNRILHDRSGLANPIGTDPKTAQENLDYLRDELRPIRYRALQKAFNATQEVFWPIVEQAHDLGVISDDLFKNTILPNKGNYVTYAVLRHLEKKGYISAGISKQEGTLEEVGNTWLGTRMKTAAMMSRNLDQKSKLAFKNLWDKRFPGELKKTKMVRMGEGPGIERPEPGKEVIYMYEDGKRVAYDVDPYIAQAFEKWKPAQMNIILKTLNLASYPFKMFYTMENAGFVFFTSPIRYFEKTYKGLSGTKGEGIIPLLANYMVSMPDSFSKAIGKPNEFVTKLIKDKVLDVSMEDLELAPELNSYRQKAKKYELEQKGPGDHGLIGRVADGLLYPLRAIFHGMQIAADTSTGAWKIAAAKIRLKAGESGPEMAYNVRNNAGIPNPRVKGTWARFTNSLFIFGNILQRHFVTAYQVMTNPTTSGGAAFKTAALDVFPALLQSFAALGALGYSAKEFYERFSKYERRHYTLIPLGSVKGGEWGWKAMAMPLPHDDVGRIIHAMTTEIVMSLAKQNPKEFQGLLGEVFSVLPGITPAIDIPAAWLQEYTTGRAVDRFRQRFVIPDTVEKIGGILKLEKMLEWTINESGLTNFQSYNPASRTTTETVIQSTPLINRMIKISDYGKKEKFNEEMQDFPLASEAYRLRQKKKEQGQLSREDALRLATLQYQAKQYRSKVKGEMTREKLAP